jgi:hypothetical protein
MNPRRSLNGRHTDGNVMYNEAVCITVCIVLMVMTWVFTPIRFYVRVALLREIFLDDVFALFAIV